MELKFKTIEECFIWIKDNEIEFDFEQEDDERIVTLGARPFMSVGVSLSSFSEAFLNATNQYWSNYWNFDETEEITTPDRAKLYLNKLCDGVSLFFHRDIDSVELVARRGDDTYTTYCNEELSIRDGYIQLAKHVQNVLIGARWRTHKY